MTLHLIDGVIARPLSLLGVSFYLVPAMRCLLFGSSVRKSYVVAGLVFGWVASILFLNILTLSVADSLQEIPSIWRPEFSSLVKWIGPAIVDTQAGNWFLGNVVVLTFLSVSELRQQSNRFLRPLGAFFWVLTFTRMGHGGSFSLLSPWFWLQLIHTLAVVTWVTGLFSIAPELFSLKWSFTHTQLKKFSNTMLVMMCIIVLSGGARALAVFVQSNNEPAGQAYVWVLATKISIVLFLVFVASRIRLLIFAGSKIDEKMQNLFSAEFFLAGILLFAAALLSQLPPP